MQLFCNQLVIIIKKYLNKLNRLIQGEKFQGILVKLNNGS